MHGRGETGATSCDGDCPIACAPLRTRQGDWCRLLRLKHAGAAGLGRARVIAGYPVALWRPRDSVRPCVSRGYRVPRVPATGRRTHGVPGRVHDETYSKRVTDGHHGGASDHGPTTPVNAAKQDGLLGDLQLAGLVLRDRPRTRAPLWARVTAMSRLWVDAFLCGDQPAPELFALFGAHVAHGLKLGGHLDRLERLLRLAQHPAVQRFRPAERVCVIALADDLVETVGVVLRSGRRPYVVGRWRWLAHTFGSVAAPGSETWPSSTSSTDRRASRRIRSRSIRYSAAAV